MTLFRISFSVLDPWSRGDIDEALRRYYHKDVQPTQPMIEGKALHELWKQETDTKKSLPAVFGGHPLVNPETEIKMEMMIDDWIQFVGVIDCLAEHTIIEYKTGRAGVHGYSSSWQPRCYQALVEANGYTVDTAMILFHNQHEQFVQKGKIYLTDQSKKDAVEWIRTFSSEFRDALDKTENHD